MAKRELSELESSKTACKPARRFSRLCREKLQRRQKTIPADTTKHRQKKKRSFVGNLVQRKGLLPASWGVGQKVRNMFV